MNTELVDLTTPRRIHVVAAGGAGMSAIATLLAEQGHQVSGSDLADSETLRRLEGSGVVTSVGHDPVNVGHAEMLVVSTAVGDDNVEVAEALRRGLPVVRRLGMLEGLARRQPLVSVSGTHGKTTTTSMLTVAMKGIGEDPSYLIGANVPVLSSAAGSGSGRFLVLEADESDGSFLASPRAAALVTNIEADHLEFWGSWDSLLSGFARFLDLTEGPTVVCADDPTAVDLGSDFGAVTYGLSGSADYRIEGLHQRGLTTKFELAAPYGSIPVSLMVPGVHNAANAAGALAVVGELGLDLRSAVKSLAGYSGVARRFESRGSVSGIQFVDDYAHLPTEVRAALAAAAGGGWRRVVTVFQPHRYSRTAALWREFADAFVDSDLTVLTDIFAAGEDPRPGVSGRLLFDAVREANPAASVVWLPTLDEAARFLAGELVEGDLCLSVGAGDVTTIPDRVASLLR